MRALGFCVSIEHARFMAQHFTRHGIAAVAVWGDSPRAEREAALRDLAAGTGPGGVLGRPVQRRRRRARSRHRAHAAPDREPHAVPPATRTWAPQDDRQDVLHGPGLRRHAPQGVPLRPPLPGAARRHSPRRRTSRAAPVPVPPRRLPHAPRRQGRRDRPAQPARRRSRPDGRPRSTSCARFAANVPTSDSPSSCTSPGSISTTSTTAARAGRTSKRPRPLPCSRPGPERDRAPPGDRTAPPHRRPGTHRHLPTTPRRARTRHIVDDSPSASAASSACSSPPSPIALISRETRHSRTPSTCSGPTLRSAHELLELLGILDDRVDHVHAPAHHAPGLPPPGPRPLQPHRDPRRVRTRRRRQDRGLAERRLRSQDCERRTARVHARQEQRRLLSHDPLSRLRHQPHPDPLGEPVDHPCRQHDRAALPEPRT